jgi:hypothetical protein
MPALVLPDGEMVMGTLDHGTYGVHLLPMVDGHSFFFLVIFQKIDILVESPKKEAVS